MRKIRFSLTWGGKLVIFGSDYELIPALVLTRTADLYRWEQLSGTTAELPVCSGDMLFNLFDEFIGFLK